MRCFRLLGTCIESPDLFQGLPECSGPGDILLRLAAPDEGPEWAAAADSRLLHARRLRDGTACFSLSEHAGGYEMTILGVARYCISRDLRSVVCHVGEAKNLHWVEGYFGGHVMGWILHQQGFDVLHGSCVTLDGQTLILLGAKGAGKSTLTALLVASGAALVADDLVPLRLENGAVTVRGGDPRMRLSDRSLSYLRERFGALGAPEGGTVKKTFLVGRDWGRHVEDPPPVSAAVVLPDPPRRARSAPCLVEPPPARALLNFLRHTYGIDFLAPDRREAQIERYAELIEKLSLSELRVSRGLRYLEETRDLLLEKLLRGPEPSARRTLRCHPAG